MWADGQGEKPREIDLDEDIRFFHALPRTGGVLDQPAGMLRKIRAARNTADWVAAYNQAADKGQWLQENQDGAKVIMLYWDLRDEMENGSIEA